jgi:hypothetical protein
MSVQGYGLFSGPTDHRLNPIHINYGRNQFIRDLMVANGDAHKAIWIAEMNWNAAPNDVSGAGAYGQVTEAQQARYAPMAYARAQAEWPWVGVNTFWFFKRADDSEKDQAWYYFRMADPDFTLRPVYDAVQAYTRQTPTMYPGWFQEDHWAVAWGEGWESARAQRFQFGRAMTAGTPGASAQFVFHGTDLTLVVAPHPDGGTLAVRVDDQTHTFGLRSGDDDGPIHLSVARGLRDAQHTVEILNEAGRSTLDGFIVRRVPDRTGPLLLVLVVILGIAWYLAKRGQREPPTP